MNLDKTQYPERYRPRDDGPMFSTYVPEPARDIGHDCGVILPPREGTVIACIEHGGWGGRNYYIDQDFTLSDKPGVKYMIWTRDSWAHFDPPKFITGASHKRTETIHAQLEEAHGE